MARFQVVDRGIGESAKNLRARRNDKPRRGRGLWGTRQGRVEAGASAAYFSSDRTDCEDWFAWASMAVAACWMICVRASSVVAVA